MPPATLVIVNPASRAGATGRRWAAIAGRLRSAIGDFDEVHTAGPRDAERLAREAARAGRQRLVVAGGDGTVSEVVTGLLGAELGERVQLGLLPLGTGGDFLRLVGVAKDLDTAIAGLRRDATRRVDAGRVEYRGRDGKPATSYFLNVASLGMSGLVDELVARAPKSLGALSLAIGAVRGIASYESAAVSLRVDGELFHEGPLVLATAANGRYFGGGARVAPEARPDDGLLDVIVIGALSKGQLLANLPALYRGTHVEHPAVTVCQGRRIEADAAPGSVWLDVDGEPLGTLPARFEVVPGAVTLFGVGAGDGEA